MKRQHVGDFDWSPDGKRADHGCSKESVDRQRDDLPANITLQANNHDNRPSTSGHVQLKEINRPAAAMHTSHRITSDDCLPGFRHRKLLDDKRVQLASLINVSDHLLNLMIERKILTEGPQQGIQDVSIPRMRAGVLLDYLKQRPESDFHLFLDCLRRDNQVHVAQVLGYDIHTVHHLEPAGVEKLAYILKAHYLTEFDKVRFLPWDDSDHCLLSDIYVNLSWEKRYRKASFIVNEKLEHYTEVLLALPGKPRPLRIFVLGEPGTGKSIFCKKIALDWASGAHPALCQFKLVLTVFLRSHKSDESLEDTIYRELLPHDKNISCDHLREAISLLGEKCLVILDGLDELSNRSNNLLGILRKKLFSNVPVIVTTRPVGEKTINCADAVAMITGFEPSGVCKYIKLFFAPEGVKTSESDQQYKECLEEIHRRGLLGLSQVPLLLHLLCLLFHNVGELPKTMTGVYTSLKKYVLKRYKSVKEDKNEHIEEDDLQSAVDNLGKLAYEGVISGNLIYDEEKLKITLSQHLLELGFLSSWNVPGKLDKQTQLTFVHKTFQEYFAAEYIVQNFTKISELWEYLGSDMRNKVLALKTMFAMCCGMSHDIGMKIMKKIQDMKDTPYNFLCYNYVSDVQLQCLCEVSEPMDISDLHCYSKLCFTGDNAPTQVQFKPTIINVKRAHVHGISSTSLTVSPKGGTHTDVGIVSANEGFVKMDISYICKMITFCTDQLNMIDMQQCELSLPVVCSLFHILPQFHLLAVLNLSFTQLSNKLHAALSGYEKEVSLKKLFMTGSELTGEDIKALAQWLWFAPKLTYLLLNHNALHGEELKPIQEVLATRQLKMQVHVDLLEPELSVWQKALPLHSIISAAAHLPELGIKGLELGQWDK